MKKISLYLSFSLITIALMIGVGLGYALTPDYRANMYTKNDMDLGAADFFLDRRYLNAMITHHQQAINLARQAETLSERKEIKDLATEIITNEPKLIDELYAYKKSWYNDRRPAPSPRQQNLGTAGETFDLRFLNALIAHHEEGINMAAEIKAKSSRTEILDNADDVSIFLNNSLTTLHSWRLDWYRL